MYYVFNVIILNKIGYQIHVSVNKIVLFFFIILKYK